MNYALREGVNAFRRAPMLAALSITTIAFSLFAFGLFGLVIPEAHGGMGAPYTLGVMASEALISTNKSFSMCPAQIGRAHV